MKSNCKSDLEARINACEEALSHQSKTIDELNLVVSEQYKQIENQEKKLSALIERFLALEENSETKAEITKPPHY